MSLPARTLTAIGAGYLALDLATASRVHGWDAIAYTARLVRHPLLAETCLSTHLFHPHHLLYLSAALPLEPLARGLGVRDPFAPLVVLSAVTGAASVVLAGWLVAAATGSRARAVLAACGLGLLNSVWLFSSEVEAMMPALLLLLIGLVGVTRARGTAAWVGAGVAMAAAVLVHQLVVLAAVGVSLALMLARPRLPARDQLAFALAWALPVAAAYVAVGVAAVGARTPTALFDWILHVRDRAMLAQEPVTTSMHLFVRGAAGSLVTLTPLSRLRESPGAPLEWLAVAAMAAALAGCALLAAGAARGVARALRARDLLTLALGLAALLMAAFILWFSPADIDHWVLASALGWMLLAAYVARPAALPARAAVALTVLTLALMTGVNLTHRVLPMMDPRTAGYRDDLRVAERWLKPGRGVLVVGPASTLGEGRIALPFFANVVVMGLPPETTADSLAPYRAETARLLGAGRPVFATEEAVALLSRDGPPPRATRRCRLAEETVYQLSAEPAAAVAPASAAAAPTAPPAHPSDPRGSRP